MVSMATVEGKLNSVDDDPEDPVPATVAQSVCGLEAGQRWIRWLLRSAITLAQALPTTTDIGLVSCAAPEPTVLAPATEAQAVPGLSKRHSCTRLLLESAISRSPYPSKASLVGQPSCVSLEPSCTTTIEHRPLGTAGLDRSRNPQRRSRQLVSRLSKLAC